VILLVAGLVPLLRHVVEPGGNATTADRSASAPAAGGGGSGSGATDAAGTALPVLEAPGSYSASALQATLAGDPTARSAYQRAARRTTAPATPGKSTLSGPSTASPQSDLGSSRAESAPPGTLRQSACLARVRDQPGAGSARPAFFVNTVYRGRPATVLVTVEANAPDRAELWAFPRDDCSTAPFAHDPVRVSPPP
jgi:hypothetical protein